MSLPNQDSRVGFVHKVTTDELGKSLFPNAHKTEKEVSQLFLGYFPAHLIGKMGQTQDISGLFFLCCVVFLHMAQWRDRKIVKGKSALLHAVQFGAVPSLFVGIVRDNDVYVGAALQYRHRCYFSLKVIPKLIRRVNNFTSLEDLKKSWQFPSDRNKREFTKWKNINPRKKIWK